MQRNFALWQIMSGHPNCQSFVRMVSWKEAVKVVTLFPGKYIAVDELGVTLS